MVSELTSDSRLAELCRQFHVKKLHVFGSSLNQPMAEARDIDLLVEFERDGFEGAFDQFMGFKEQLEALLGRPVDLITKKRFRNPIFQEEIERTKATVYAA